MEIEIKFNELERFSFLKKEISSFFTEEFIVVDSFVRERRWAHATLDDKQIFESDAINLSNALYAIGCDSIYAAWACNFFSENDDFFVKRFSSDVSSIEEVQNPYSEIDHLESFFFSGYPLKFLIVRPDTHQQLLHLLGPVDFVSMVAKEEGWKIVF